MEFDKSGLNNILFEEFKDSSSKKHIFICNMATSISRWSIGAVEYFGLPGEYMKDAGLVWSEHIHPDDRMRYLQDIQEVFAGKKEVHRLDYRAKNSKGDYVLCTCKGKVVLDEEKGDRLFIGTIENHGIRDNVDATTNLYNIYEFSNKMKSLKEQGKTVTILEIGINNFSEINEVYGYAYGNRVLSVFGEQLCDRMKDRGSIFRMDGVRFACFFESVEKAELEAIYENLKQMAGYEIIVDGNKIAISISGGVVFRSRMYDEGSIQTSADYALSQSKHEYHGQLVFVEDKKISENFKTIECMSTIRSCILNKFDGFYLCYQPIMDAKEEQMIGAEALLRWKKEPFGEVPPGVFLPWLENDPCFFELGNWILRTALTETKTVLSQYPDFILNINLAYPQLSNMKFCDSLREIIRETGFPPENICLELTERCRQLGRDELLLVVQFMKALGIKIALDDFGTGTSSLNLLGFLPVDTLKIDREFIWNIKENRANQEIVKSVSECARKLDVKVCVEGLENREMIDFIKQYPVNSFQGFHFSRPIPLNQFCGKYLSFTKEKESVKIEKSE